jgi:hypothetical protein
VCLQKHIEALGLIMVDTDRPSYLERWRELDHILIWWFCLWQSFEVEVSSEL